MDGAWQISYFVLWGIVVVLATLFLGLLREVGGLHSRVGPPGVLVGDEGLDVGMLAPDFSAKEAPGGREVNFRAASGRDSVLIFITPNCEQCTTLLPGLAKSWPLWQRLVDIWMVCEGNEQEVIALAEKMKVQLPMLADPVAEIRAAYGRPPTPFAYLIGAEGTIRLKGLVNSRDDVDLLVEGRGRAPGGRELFAPIENGRQSFDERMESAAAYLAASERVDHEHVD